MKKIRLLIVDDSIYLQLALRSMLSAHPEIEIVGAAADGEKAVEMACELKPDLITMDVTMPRMDGVEATRRIMRQAPTAVVMLSTLTEKGAAATFTALEAGAVDFVAKSGSAVDIDLRTVTEQLSRKVLFWGRRQTADRPATAHTPITDVETDLQIFFCGGGSQTLVAALLRARAGAAAPALIVPTIPANFTAAFVDYLARVSGCAVAEAGAQTRLVHGDVCVAPAGRRGIAIKEPSGVLYLALGRHIEAMDIVASAATAAAAPHLIVLSGEAQPTDGWEGAFAKSRARIWVQAPDDCALSGMPNAVLTKRLRSEVVEPQAMLAALSASTRRTAA